MSFSSQKLRNSHSKQDDGRPWIMATTKTCSSSETFLHSFEGWSVWIEPCEEESFDIVKEMEYLATKCGGAVCGVHPFVPHCTLLYNLTPLSIDAEATKEETCRDLLHKCIDTFRQEWNADESIQNDEDDANTVNTQEMQLIPTDFYYFPYPKHADDGKGFGCVISLLLLEQTSILSRLHQAVTKTFPPDERQANFVPHLSLVYAPENKAKWLQYYTNDTLAKSRRDLLQPLTARYLSLWSTQGQVNNWYRIARVKLS